MAGIEIAPSCASARSTNFTYIERADIILYRAEFSGKPDYSRSRGGGSRGEMRDRLFFFALFACVRKRVHGKGVCAFSPNNAARVTSAQFLATAPLMKPLICIGAQKRQP